jgi:uncharacterized protein YbaP (TraB family)
MTFTDLRKSAGHLAVSVAVACLSVLPVTGQSLASVARPPQPAVEKGTAKGFIWKVERGGRTAWLVGSLHLLSPDFYPLPATMDQAFAGSDVLMEEIDMNEASDPKVAAGILAMALNPAGTTLSSQLSKETLAAVGPWLAKRNLPIEAFQTMKPWMLSITIQTLSLQSIGFDPAFGIDKHFQDAAARAGKRLMPLETALEQISFLDSLSPKTQDQMLRESIEAAETEMGEIKALAAAWRAGDVAAMERLALADMKDAPDVYDTLLVSRNRRWLPKIEACMQANRACFVVVGAAHLIGPDGVVALMKGRGHTVTQY